MQIKTVIRCHISPIKSAMIFKHIHPQAQSWSVCTEAGTYRKEWCNPPGKQSSLISRTFKKKKNLQNAHNPRPRNFISRNLSVLRK